MNDVYEKLIRCLESVRARVDFKPKAALVLGSGLGDYASCIRVEQTLDYNEIDGFPVSTVPGHRGRFLFGYVGEVPIVAMQGRVHYYEGYSMSDVVLPVRLMGLLGAERLLLTNAAGGLHEEMASGQLMLITDQISCFVPSPLIGQNAEALGTRFPDMSEIYRRELCELIRRKARELDISLSEGTYLQLSGSAYESPAEVRMCRILGADAVGMSTACEAIAANHMGMRVCGISCITNLAAGISDQPLKHSEVQAAADRIAPQFQSLVTAVISEIAAL